MDVLALSNQGNEMNIKPFVVGIALVVIVFGFGVIISKVAEAEEYDNALFNDSASSSSSNMSNFQLNNNSNSRHRIGDVDCSAPAVDMGITGPRSLSSRSMAYIAFNYPLGGSVCRDAQRQRLTAMKYNLVVAKIEQNKKDIIFQERMATVCIALHKTVMLDPDSVLYKECSVFEPTHGHPSKNVLKTNKVAPHG